LLAEDLGDDVTQCFANLRDHERVRVKREPLYPPAVQAHVQELTHLRRDGGQWSIVRAEPSLP
jgi:hypothetical protein